MNWKNFAFMVILGIAFNAQGIAQDMKIVTIDSPLQDVLKRKTDDILETEFALAAQISEELFAAVSYLPPAAGLAAPQIGISKSVFIYTYDRDPQNLEVVVNPSYEPIGDARITSWEGCFSVMLSNGIYKLASIPRYEVIRVTYRNLSGEIIEKTLEGFAAKVFQHEYDHLQGVINITRRDAVVKEFMTHEEMMSFIQEIKKMDSGYYKKPN